MDSGCPDHPDCEQIDREDPNRVRRGSNHSLFGESSERHEVCDELTSMQVLGIGCSTTIFAGVKFGLGKSEDIVPTSNNLSISKVS